MSIERLKSMKDTFMCAVEGQMYNLSEVDAEELGEVVDMIKDLSEAIYYCEVTKAMEKSEENEKSQNGSMMYYTPMRYRGDWESAPMSYNEDRMFYTNRGGSTSNSNGSSGNGRSSNSSSNGTSGNSSYYHEREFPNAFQDEREGKSYRSRRMYMEARESKQDKTAQMRELEKYAQELTQDIVDMIQDASIEERQFLGKKIALLANKITQTNG